MQDEKNTTRLIKPRKITIYFVLSKWVKTGYFNGRQFYALVVVWPTGNTELITQCYNPILIEKQYKRYLLIKK